MSAVAQALPRGIGARRLVLTIVLSAGLATASTLLLVSLLGGQSRAPRGLVYSAPGHAFAIAYPAGWNALPPAQLRGVPGSPALVLRSPDRKAAVVVRASAAPAGEPLSKLATELTAALKKRLTDFKPVNMRLAGTRGGAAFLYTFARTKAGLVQSIMVTRIRGRAYSLYGIAPAASPGLAHQVGQVLGTFGQ